MLQSIFDFNGGTPSQVDHFEFRIGALKDQAFSMIKSLSSFAPYLAHGLIATGELFDGVYNFLAATPKFMEGQKLMGMHLMEGEGGTGNVQVRELDENVVRVKEYDDAGNVVKSSWGRTTLYPINWSSIMTQVAKALPAEAVIEFFIRFLINAELSEYVSTLAERIQLPPDEIGIETHELGPYTLRTPKQVSSQPVVVTYMDDIKGTVESYHRIWFAFQTRHMVFMQGNHFAGAPGFTLPINYTPLDGDGDYIQERYRLYPAVYPSKIETTGGENSGTDFKKVTVTYERSMELYGLALGCPIGNPVASLESDFEQSPMMPYGASKFFTGGVPN